MSEPSPSLSPYAPRPARSQVHRATAADTSLLPVGGRALPHLRKPGVLVARYDQAEWSPVLRDFLPTLDFRPSVPGAQGVDRDGQGGEDVRHQQIDLERKRWRVLVNGDPILEAVREEGKFLVEYACERGLKAVVPFWETPEVTGREDEVKWREDLEAKHAFIRALIDARIIEPITKDACRAALGRVEKSYRTMQSELASSKHPSASAELRAKQLSIRLAHMEARIAGEDPFDFEAEPAPTGRVGQAKRVTKPAKAAKAAKSTEAKP